MATTNLSTKAMLAMLQITKWSASKHDKKASQEVTTAHNADTRAGKFRKRLLSKDSKALEGVNKAANEARVFHYANTLPWGQDGSRILPKENYFEYVDAMRKFREQFNDAVRMFLGEYPTLREGAREMLGSLYQEADYPGPAELELKFSFDTVFLPFPDEKDFRVDLGEEELKDIRRQIAKQSTEAVTVAMRDAWTRLHEAVARMSDRLSQDDAIFRDSLVSNLNELCDVLPKLNVGDDPALAKMCEEVRTKLGSKSPEELRDNKGVREKTALDAKQIMEMMSGYVGGTAAEAGAAQ